MNKKQISITELLEKLNNLPPKNTTDFFVELPNLFELLKDNKMIEELNKILNERKEKISIRYNIMALLVSYNERMENYKKAAEIINQFRYDFSESDDFRDHINYYLSLMYRTNKIYVEALKYAEKAILYMPDNLGFCNNYSEIAFLLLEENIYFENNVKHKEYYDKAIMYIRKAIDGNNNYAKYHYNLGMLYAINKNFSDAKLEIQSAIEMEDNHIEDYSLRILKYKNGLSMIDYLKNKSELIESNKKIKDMMNKLNDERNKNFEFIGFFAGIITFLISSINISFKLDFSSSVSLMVILLGCIIISFSSLRVIFRRDDVWKDFIILIIIGVSFIILGVIFNRYL